MRSFLFNFDGKWQAITAFLIVAALMIGVGVWVTGGKVTKIETVDGQIIRFGGRYAYGQDNRVVVIVRLKNGDVWQVEDRYARSRNCHIGNDISVSVIYRRSGPTTKDIVRDSCKQSQRSNG